MEAAAIAYQVRRSTRARRVGVTVDGARGVEVVLPGRVFDRGAAAREREAAAAIRELRPWIERRVRDLERARAAVAARRGTVPYLGQPLRLIAEPGRARAYRRGADLFVPAGDAQLPAIERFYRRSAHAEVSSRLDRACAQVGASYERLEIRGQKTRWASCSRSGTMSFNWRLLLAPESVLDYVVWHEVCHLDVMDHSRKFWTLLGERCPGYREQLRWLRRHGPTLVV